MLENLLPMLPPTMESPQLDSTLESLLPDPMLPPIVDSTILDSKSWTDATDQPELEDHLMEGTTDPPIHTVPPNGDPIHNLAQYF